MISLNPGPSELSPETKRDIQAAIEEGIVSLSHRSTKFTEISRRCVEELRVYLGVPDTYRIFYFDSATHVWHSLVANLVETHSHHFVNGSFSGKAYDAATALHKQALKAEVAWGSQHDFSGAAIPKEAELVTACYNETSTGVKMLPEEVRTLREKHPEPILAVDITSCAGAVRCDISEADVWYFSVQKCFGLPAGLGIAIVSPRAYERALELEKRKKNLAGIWSWSRLEETMRENKYQTPHTPNVLDIFLLGAECERWNKAGGIERIITETKEKKVMLESRMSQHPRLSLFVSDEIHRSDTVITIQAEPELVIQAREVCKEEGITLGSGYGKIKANTFRIANFPAVGKKVIAQVLDVLHAI